MFLQVWPVWPPEPATLMRADFNVVPTVDSLASGEFLSQTGLLSLTDATVWRHLLFIVSSVRPPWASIVLPMDGTVSLRETAQR